MKKLIAFIAIFILFTGSNIVKAQDLSPYIKVGVSNDNMEQIADQVKIALQEKGFEIIGKYNTLNNKNFLVIAFSRKDLQSTVLKVTKNKRYSNHYQLLKSGIPI